MTRIPVRRWTLLLVAAGTALALAGCGGSTPEKVAPVAQVSALPPVPAELAVSVGSSDATVTWTPATVESVVGFDVYLDKDEPVAVPASSGSYTFSGLAAGSHYAQVVAKSQDARSLPASMQFDIADPSVVASVAPADSPVQPSAEESDSGGAATTDTLPTMSLTDACTEVTYTMADVIKLMTGVIQGSDDPAISGRIVGSDITRLQEIAAASPEPLPGLILTYTVALGGLQDTLSAGNTLVGWNSTALDSSADSFINYCSSQIG